MRITCETILAAAVEGMQGGAKARDADGESWAVSGGWRGHIFARMSGRLDLSRDEKAQVVRLRNALDPFPEERVDEAVFFGIVECEAVGYKPVDRALTETRGQILRILFALKRGRFLIHYADVGHFCHFRWRDGNKR